MNTRNIFVVFVFGDIIPFCATSRQVALHTLQMSPHNGFSQALRHATHKQLALHTLYNIPLQLELSEMKRQSSTNVLPPPPLSHVCREKFRWC